MPSAKPVTANQRKSKGKSRRGAAREFQPPSQARVEDRTGLSARFLACLLLLSGSCALVYQLLWIKQLSLIVGVEIYAITTAVSAFFAGLAVGGAIFGWVADRMVRPLRLYAQIEIATAAGGIATTILLAHSARLFAVAEAQAGVCAWVPLFAVVAAPAALMGGTLPVLMRAARPDEATVAETSGVFYAANTAGAAIGALITPFFLLPLVGVTGAAVCAATMNAALGVIAFYLAGVSKEIPEERDTILKTTERALGVNEKSALALYAVAGGIALGYEVVWSQAIVPFMSTRAFAFAIVLATYLVGMVLGSAAYAKFLVRVKDGWTLFGALIAAAGLLALIGVASIGKWFLYFQYNAGHFVYSLTSSEMAEMCTRFLGAAGVAIFPAALFLGAAFPAAVKLTAGEKTVGRDVGAVLALNTAGGILGTVIIGFLLIPRIGIVRALAVLAVGAGVVGLLAVFHARARIVSVQPNRGIWIVSAIAAATILVAALTPSDHLVRLLPAMHGSAGNVIFHEDDPGGTVAVLQEPPGPNSFRRLYIQGVSNSGDSLPSLRYMRLQALLPLLIHSGEPHSELVIGLGTGITAGATLRYSALERRVCDELMPGVIQATAEFQGNYGAGSDSRLEIRHRDGRRDLLQRRDTYDVITLEPPPPAAAGVVNLYSRDFYRLAAIRLAPNGILAQWLPIATQNNEDTKSLVRSFLDVFPYASLWTTELHEMLLVGSLQPMTLDMPTIFARFEQSGVKAALGEVGIESSTDLLSAWVTGRDGLEEYAAGAEPVTDDRPRIEYATWVRRGVIETALPELMALRTIPPMRGADDEQWNEVTEKRDHLMALYSAGLAAYQGDREQWARNIERVQSDVLTNAYYRWLVEGNGGAGSGTARPQP